MLDRLEAMGEGVRNRRKALLLAENDNRAVPGQLRRSTPRVAWRFSKEAVHLLWALLDASVVALACLLVVDSVTPTGLLMTSLGAASFVLVKALSRGYAR